MSLQRTPKPSASELAALRSRLKREPENGRLWLVLAQMLMHFPPGQELQQAADRSIRLLPDNYQAWLLSASLLQHRQGAAAALAWLESISRQNPELAAVRLARASLSLPGDPDGAIRQFEDIMQAYPSDTRAHELLVEFYRGRGRLSEAAGCLERVLHIKPEEASYWRMLGEIRLAEGQWQKAVKAATAAIDLDSSQWIAREVRGDAHQKANAWNEALSDYLAVARQQNNNPRVLNKVGVCLIRKDRPEEARKYFDKALQLDPDFADAKVNLGFMQALWGRREKAVDLIQKALADEKLEAQSRHAAVVALAVLQEQQRLEPYIRQALESASVDGLHAALGDAPGDLSKPHAATVRKLRTLADMCREHRFQPVRAAAANGAARQLAFIEACAHCKLDREALIALARQTDIAAGPPGPGFDGKYGEVGNVWRMVLDRRESGPGVLSTAKGEAWLRYWHARLLVSAPEKQPGHYKAIQNTVGRLTPPPPANVSGTYRAVLLEMREAVPAGVARGVFMLLALNLVHSFVDGNGRLSRFTLAWEMEGAGLPADVIPAELRDDYIRTLVAALWQGELVQFEGVLQSARQYLENLLEELNH